MKQVIINTFFIILVIFSGLIPSGIHAQGTVESDTYRLYEQLELEGKLDYAIFQDAIEGMEAFSFNRQDILSIIDYTRPSSEKRLFIVDLEKGTLVYHTLVAHGRNSGNVYAEDFSNRNKSLMSSMGVFRTAETYHGKHGYSLKLDGLEEGVNDHARERLIVMHGASYVSQNFIEKYGRLGRSWGCPALPPALTEDIIDLIKGGSCLYIHGIDVDGEPENH